MSDLMIDIETLATHNFASLVLSVTAVPFSLGEERPHLRQPVSWVLDLREQLATGRIVDGKTQLWWSEQSEIARMHWQHPGSVVGLEAFADEFCGWVKEKLTDGDAVWANGVIFDLGNVESLLGQVHRPLPWKYNQVRDYRTIVRMIPDARAELDHGWKEKDMAGFPPHHPVGDCIRQIWNLWHCAPIPPKHREEQT